MKKDKIIVGLLVLVGIAVGIFLLSLSNNYDVELKEIKVFNEGEKVTLKPVYQMHIKRLILENIGQILIAISTSIGISIFIISIFTKKEKDDFEAKLIEFQRKVAENAISSTFDLILPSGFIDLFKKDIIGAKLMRRNVKWNYIISKEEESGKLKLRRLISYELINISSVNQSEEVILITGSNLHAQTMVGANNTIESEGKKEMMEFKIEDKGKGFFKYSRSINIKPNEALKINYEVIQLFNSNYVYEAHSTRHSILDLTLTVNLPKGFTFDISPSMGSNLVEEDHGDFKKYKSQWAILKGQGIEFYAAERASSPVSPNPTIPSSGLTA
ncbi:MAG: hypothetical protein H6581_26710 [Bacteroidia bacterium]|nr:hypothetical protein [Bacteroidia bacterium]